MGTPDELPRSPRLIVVFDGDASTRRDLADLVASLPGTGRVESQRMPEGKKGGGGISDPIIAGVVVQAVRLVSERLLDWMKERRARVTIRSRGTSEGTVVGPESTKADIQAALDRHGELER